MDEDVKVVPPMLIKILRISAFSQLIWLSGCSFPTDSLWPSTLVFGSEDQVVQSSEEMAEISEDQLDRPDLAPAPPPALGQTIFAPPAVTQATTTGTFVGQKVAQHRTELIALQNTIVQRNQQLQSARLRATEDSQRYHGTIAAIKARLQLGTTPGNPVLTSQWQAAQLELERLNADVTQLNSLANNVASDSAMAAYLLEAARATYGLAGAIDEDHRQLAILEDETNRTVVLIDRLLNELSEDISRQTSYIGSERRNLNVIGLAIQNGEILGNSLFNRAFANAAPVGGGIPTPAAAVGLPAGQQPLVIIRFDRPNVQFEQPLYNAISEALERRPRAIFDLVAVAATGGTTAEAALNISRAKQNADDVVRALADMGLPAERLRLSSTSSSENAINEIRIYVR